MSDVKACLESLLTIENLREEAKKGVLINNFQYGNWAVSCNFIVKGSKLALLV